MMFRALAYGAILFTLKSVFATIAITGVQGGVNLMTGQRPLRQEFSIFQSSGAAFDLYILSLQKFAQMNQTNELSYYQVAGIHGYPNIPWDGVQGNDYGIGYCTHSSILFPSWHRPYVALFEQILWENAQSIAVSYPASTRAEYEAAAVTFRIPYWDWSTSASIPDAINDPLISINGPGGPLTMTNPLYNYTFDPQPSAADFPPGYQISSYHSTVRYPNSTGQSQPNLVNLQLKANAPWLHDGTYQLLASEPNYGPFSNTGYTDSNGDSFNSLENMHNAIHALVGNGGHMSWIPYSGFDPIFWLHHANVDRLLAIWQALYPNSYTIPEPDSAGTYTNAPGEIEDIDTALTPFHSNTVGTLHTSATVRYIKTYGYSYPEIIDWGDINATQLSQNVRAKVNALYNPPASPEKRSLSTNTKPSTKIIRTTNSTKYQWIINIRADRSLLPSSLFLHFFLGPPPPIPQALSFAPNLIGTHSFLIPPPTLTYRTPPPRYPNTTYIHASIPLTHALLPLLPSLSPPYVLPLLRSQLSVRAQNFDDSVISEEEVGRWGLRMRVAGREVLGKGGGDKFPVYGAWKGWGNVGAGGGLVG